MPYLLRRAQHSCRRDCHQPLLRCTAIMWCVWCGVCCRLSGTLWLCACRRTPASAPQQQSSCSTASSRPHVTLPSSHKPYSQPCCRPSSPTTSHQPVLLLPVMPLQPGQAVHQARSHLCLGNNQPASRQPAAGRFTVNLSWHGSDLPLGLGWGPSLE